MTWYHGTPDVRPLCETGGFVPRFESHRLMADTERLKELWALGRSGTLSPTEERKRLEEIESCWTSIEAPVPVFLSARRSTAETYADDKRAFDFQSADPAVLEIQCHREADVILDAKRGSFRSLSWAAIEPSLARSEIDIIAVREALEKRPGLTFDRIRVSDLGLALWSAGAQVVDIRNVVDTYNGQGRPDTVRMVFDVESLEITNLADILEQTPDGFEP